MWHSLRTRLLLASIGVAVLAVLTLSGAVLYVTRDNMLRDLNQHLSGQTQQYAGELAQWIGDKRQVTSSIRLALDQPDPMPMLRAAEKAGLDLAYFVRADKSHAFTSPRPADYDGTQRGWYKQAVQEGKPGTTAAYPDSGTGRLVVSLVEPIIENGQTTAVIASDVELTTVIEKVKAIHPTSKSFGVLLDAKSNQILVAPSADLTLKPITALDDDLSLDRVLQLASSNGHTEATLGAEDDFVYAAKIKGTDWLLLVVAEKSDALKGLTHLAWIAGGVTLLSALGAALVMLLIITRLLRRLPLVRNALADIASGEGDLTRRMDASGKDELAQIAHAFNQFADKIAAVLLQIRASAENVRVATTEIASGNQDLSNRTEQQASSLEETAAAMEELTATVQQNAANAQQARKLAHDASDIAVHGGEVVDQVVQTMGGIEQASRKIEAIISVIDGIAFQTNILALNAAVEAARAGEQGRGFAVVASEVRTLAGRSAEAAKEIKALIEDSVTQVASGSRQVQGAGATMAQVVDSIRQVNTIVAEISNASQEQSTGIAEVGTAVGLMDQATQQNAALVEEATAAAQSLQQQAQNLADVVAGFKLPESVREQALLSRR
ncbi:MAG: methyl-accepting chemotaxis protein [Comamonas sp.]|jgi:methyl-accepting chemotaxis protein|nr:methyl-accepting chemotaxis protein [Comamonas sp.]